MTKKLNSREYSRAVRKEKRDSRNSLISGSTIGHLTLVEYIGNNIWKCECVCGVTITKSIENIMHFYKASCGCLNPFVESNYHPENALYRLYIKGADIRNYSFSLSFYDFSTLLDSECYYCGDVQSGPSFTYNYTIFKRNGIDRIDNDLNYTIDNTVSCCTMCNKMKLSYTKQDFVNQILKIAKKQRGY
jgi:hypothetical protein